MKRIKQFHDVCKDTLTFNGEQSFFPVNRFMCMDRLEQAVQRKKGAYSEKVRLDWLYIMHACLAAPDCYFSQRIQKKNKKMARYFEDESELFQQRLELDRSWNSGIYTYIDCLRDYLRVPATSEDAPYASNMKKGLEKALQDWLGKNICSGKIKEIYQEKLDLIFQKRQSRLNHPVFFLLLPYYVFWNLIQNEDDESRTFSGIALNKTTLNWSIRSSPIKIYNASDMKWMRKLYHLIEKTLCEVLRSERYCCTGKWAWMTSYRHAKVLGFLNMETYSASEGLRYSKFGIIPQGSKEAMDEDAKQESWVRRAVYFSAPLWSYKLWTERLYHAFKLEHQSLEHDLQRLFSLLFRPELRQTKQEIENIRRKYQDARTVIGKTEFNLFELMLALGAIYNPAHFRNENTSADELEVEPEDELEDGSEDELEDELEDESEIVLDLASLNTFVHQFERELTDESKNELKLEDELKDAIALLTKFITVYNNRMDEDGPEGDNRPLDLDWLDLLREGFPQSSEAFYLDNPDDFLINPSRILVQALFMRTIANQLDSYPEDSTEIQDYFYDAALLGPRGEYDTPMQTVQSAICNALPSLRNLISDASVWGGIKLTGESFSSVDLSLRNALRIWRFLHPEQVSICEKIADYLRKNLSCIKDLITDLQDIEFKPEKMGTTDVNLFSFDFGVTKRLLSRKNLVIGFLPAQLKEQLGDPSELNDFYYAMLLFAVFFVLRERMCAQARKLSLKILPFS